MAGHSHWARIKRAKAANDAKRGRAWSKLARAIMLAARNGPDPSANLSLRYAIDAARAENMPRDTIERAIKKGSGELGAESFEELAYEGYGPGGAALLVEAVTDNRNRTAPEIKKILETNGGNLGATNCVAWMFSRRGTFLIPADTADEERLTEIALESGADDISRAGDSFELSCDPSAFEDVRAALTDAGITPSHASLAMIPSSTVNLTGEEAARMLKLVDALEEHDDVQNVYGNYEIADEELEQLLA